MTATEELRRMLDERGVEWWPSDDRQSESIITHWRVGFIQWTAIEGEKDLWLNAGVAGYDPLTPEQAIAATLGTGTCIADETETISVRGDTWGYYFDKHFTIHVMECSECGHTYEHVWGNYEYCPHCGRRAEFALEDMLEEGDAE